MAKGRYRPYARPGKITFTITPQCNSSVLTEESKSKTSAFDLLFQRSIPHILEKIFLSLDYKTFKACHKVCAAWAETLASKPFRKKAISVYAEKASLDQDLLMDVIKLCIAMVSRNTERMRQLIACEIFRKACVNPLTLVKTQIGRSQFSVAPLHYAAGYGHADVVKVLLEEGENPNRRNSRGDTALITAIEYGRIDVVRLLLDAGANPNEEGRYDRPPVTWAVIQGYGDIVRELLGAGADPNQTYCNVTLLQIANLNVRNRTYKRVVGILLEGGANP